MTGETTRPRWWAFLVLAMASFCASGLRANGLLQAQTESSQPTSASAPQSDAVELEPGKPVASKLNGRRKDVFQLGLASGQFARTVIERPTPGLTVRIVDPGGAVQVEADSKAGEARDILDFVAEQPGTFRLEVAPKYPEAPAIRYRIRIDQLRTASEQDVDLYAARRRYSDAWQLYRIGAYAKAQAAAERALALEEKIIGAENPEVASTLNVLGLIDSARCDYSRAGTLLKRAMAIDQKAFGNDHLATAEVADSLAQTSSATANYAEAERLARQALGVREKILGTGHFLVASSQVTLGEMFLVKAEYSAARTFAEQALEITGKSYSAKDLPYTDAVSLLARVQIRQGNFASAEQLLLQNMRDREAAGGADSFAVANALQDLGSLYLLKIDNVKSEQMNLRALALKEKILGPDHIQVAYILHNLGLIYYRRDDYPTAETFYQRSLAIKEKVLGPDHPLVGPTLNNLGLLYWRQLDYPKAAGYYQRALAISERVYGPESIEITYALGNLAIIAKETGDYEKAETYNKRVLAIKEKVVGPEHPDTGIALESLGILYRDTGDYAKAEPYLLRSIAITNAAMGVDHPDNVRHLRNLSQLYQAEGDIPKTLESLQRLDALEEKDLPLNLAVGSERQKLAYFESFVSSMERIISFQVQQDPGASEARDLAATALVYRKGRVLDAMTDSLSALWRRSAVEDRAVLDRLREVTSQLAALVLNGPKQLSLVEHQQRIKDLTAQREDLENQVARRSAGFYQGTQADTLTAVQAAIPANTVLIELGVYRPFDPKKSFESHKQFGDPRYVAYVISSHGEVQAKDLGPAKDVDATVSAFREALRDPERQDVRQLARALYNKVMRPVRSLTGDASHLLVSPDGQLDLIPFEALIDEQGRYLVETLSVSYLTTGRDLLRMQVARESRSGPMVIADPAFGEPENPLLAKAEPPKSWPAATNRRRSITTGEDLSAVYFAPLAGTAREARAIQSLFPEAQLFTGTRATKIALKQANAPRILHIATHGFFLQNAAATAASDTRKPAANDSQTIHGSAPIENPLLRSGLALSGANLTKGGSEEGILTALEAANLNLWGTRLVTLSACETGVGDVKNGEGVYGLRRAFVLAGAETVVMSLWPVSDHVTREMMTAYYTGLKNGLGRGEALRQAELAMLKRQGRQHPFYWASFIQSGEWANLDGKR